MRFPFMVMAFCLFAAPVMAADKDLTCAEINAELAELNDIVTAAGNAELTNDVTYAAGSAAMQGAASTGFGSVPLIGGIANIASAVSSHNEKNAVKNAEEAEKRMIKLTTISEMKECGQ